jgi:hypothetical protein
MRTSDLFVLTSRWKPKRCSIRSHGRGLPVLASDVGIQRLSGISWTPGFVGDVEAIAAGRSDARLPEAYPASRIIEYAANVQLRRLGNSLLKCKKSLMTMQNN